MQGKEMAKLEDDILELHRFERLERFRYIQQRKATLRQSLLDAEVGRVSF